MKKILVIEDNAAIRQEIADILSFEGFEVRQASNGRVGLDLVRQAPPDLVICDLMMPEMDGYETLRALRQHPDSATLPFLCLTARAERLALRRAMEGGADDYITKPFTAAELLAAIAAAFEKKAGADRARAARTEQLRTRVTAGLPDDLRAPLLTILHGAEAIQHAARSERLGAVPDVARDILASGGQLFRIAESFLLYAQLELGDAQAEPGKAGTSGDDAALGAYTVRADLTAREIVWRLAHEHGRAADLVLDLQPSLVCITEPHLAKLLQELARNALTASAAGTPLRVTTEDGAGRARLRISDEGCGMTSEQVDAARQQRGFQQIIEQRQRLGLGLTIAHRIVALWGGRLEIDSTPGRGTTVIVDLPAAPAHRDQAAPAAAPCGTPAPRQAFESAS